MDEVPEPNRTVVQSYFREVLNQCNLEKALKETDRLFASDHVIDEPGLPEEARGPNVIKYIVAMMRRVSPDIRVRVEDEIEEGDKVVIRWSARGPLADELKKRGVARDEVRMSAISIFRVCEGEIKETWQRLEVPADPSESSTPRKEIREWLYEDPLIQAVFWDPQVQEDTPIELLSRWCCRHCPWLC